jgi:hypothetical protein
MTKERICTACWITKATNTHSEYVINITFPLQHSLPEVASVLHYAYIACHQIQLPCRSEDGHRSCPRDVASIFILNKVGSWNSSVGIVTRPRIGLLDLAPT